MKPETWLVELGRRAKEPFYAFHPLKGSQQQFIDSTARVQGVLGGNGSGKSTLGAYKLARYLFTNPPPRPGTPAWVISKSYDMVGSIAWGEKLSQFIQPRNIGWVSWANKARGWPAAVGLKNGWVLEMKSWEQGREAMQGRSIGPAWFDEQFPSDVFLETFARTRDYGCPIWFTLTPIEPDPFLEDRYHATPEGWEWISLDLEDNRKSRGGHVDDDWIDAFIREIPEDFRDVRVRGKFCGFQGAVYKSFRRDIHVVEPWVNNVPPGEGLVVRSIDFGFNNPFVCLWAHRDGDGCWTIFDEHYKARELIRYHARAIQSRPQYRQNISRTWADPEDAQSRYELCDLGLPTEMADKSKMAGIEEVQKMLAVQENGKPRLRITKNCVHTIQEMAGYRWETNTSDRKDAADEPMKKNDHTVDALRYLVYNERNQGWLEPSPIKDPLSISAGFGSMMSKYG